MAREQVFKFGKSTIIVQDEFEDGHANGFIAYPNQNQPLTDRAIYELIVNNILY